MLTKKQYEDIKSNMALCISGNYKYLNGFLQRFYAINAIRELVNEDDDLADEFDVLMTYYLDDIYSDERFNKTIGKVTGSVSEEARRAVTTMALLDTVFPEFLDGRFNPNTMSTERKEAVSFIFENSDIYKYSTDNFRTGLKSIVDAPIKRAPISKLKQLKFDENDLSL